MPTADDVVAEARKWLGTPFHHQGRCLGVGVDCVGIVSETGRALGLTTHDSARYSRHPDGESLVAGLKQAGMIEIPIVDARKGDVVVFLVRRMPRHVAILSRAPGTDGADDPGAIIHAHMGVDRAVETNIGPGWAKNLAHAFRIPGVE